MVDKIIVNREGDAVMVFTDRSPVVIHSDGCIFKMLSWFLSPIPMSRPDAYTSTDNQEDTAIFEEAA